MQFSQQKETARIWNSSERRRWQAQKQFIDVVRWIVCLGESEIKIGTKWWWPPLLCVGKFCAGAKCGGGGHVRDAVVRIPLWVQMVGSALVFCFALHLLPRFPPCWITLFVSGCRLFESHTANGLSSISVEVLS
jgi:hypothetical protein